jgi:hypothetical protein
LTAACAAKQSAVSEAEFSPGPELSVAEALAAYRARGRERRLRQKPAVDGRAMPTRRKPRLTRVLLHLINETARHAGNADATRELLDGTTGE